MLKVLVNTAPRRFLRTAPGVVPHPLRPESKRVLSEEERRVINQLASVSSYKRIPQRLHLCREDIVKHLTIENAWLTYKADCKRKREDLLQKQFDSTKQAMDTLQKVDQELFDSANMREVGHRFSPELKVPTDYPRNTLWYYTFKK